MSIRKKILDILQDAPDQTLTRAQLITALQARHDGIETNAVAQALLRMGKDGTLVRPERGTYQMTRIKIVTGDEPITVDTPQARWERIRALAETAAP